MLGFKKFIYHVLSDNSEVIKSMRHKNLGDIVLDTFPVQFVTKHTKKEEKPRKTKSLTLNHLLRFYLGIPKSFLKKTIAVLKTEKHILKSKSYELLFYLPNQKYINKSYFIISNFKLEGDYSEVFTLDNNYLVGQFIHSIKEMIFFITYPIYLFSRRDYEEISILIANRCLYSKLIHRIYVFNSLFKHYKFRKYFSFMPNGDDHRLIQLYFKNFFGDTFGIRPESMCFAEEHKYHVSDSIFYKNEFERKIYEHYNTQRKYNLIKGGILIDKQIQCKQKLSTGINNVLVLDTCTNENPKSDVLREQGLKIIYADMRKILKEKLFYHKFHPGLKPELRKATHTYLQTLDVNVIEAIDDFCTFDLIITYYTSYLQLAILSKRPCILLTGEFNLSYNNKNFKSDLDNSPIKQIKTKAAFAGAIEEIALANRADLICNTQQLYFWYKNMMNYPEGIETIIHMLNK